MLTMRKPQLLIIVLFLTPVIAAARPIHRPNSDHSGLTNYEWRWWESLQPEIIGRGKLIGPEDILHDEKTGEILTGCRDGWIKRIKITKSVSEAEVENWVNTGGRPLGLSWAPGGNDLIVADADLGLLKINRDREVKLLTNEANGVPFKLTDGVTVAADGKVYFTDASSKYGIKSFLLDILAGFPNGRLLSYDLYTNQTRLLAHDLYFPNGVALSPNLDFLVVCETPKRRCKKYYLKGKRKGKLDDFAVLPGMPDNIHFNDGNFWIAAATLPEAATIFDVKGQVYAMSLEGEVTEKYSGDALKHIASSVKIGPVISLFSNGGDFVVALDENPIAQFSDPQLKLIASGLKIENHLCISSLVLTTFFVSILIIYCLATSRSSSSGCRVTFATCTCSMYFTSLHMI